MNPPPDTLTEAALRLPPAERVRLAEALLRSVEPEDGRSGPAGLSFTEKRLVVAAMLAITALSSANYLLDLGLFQQREAKGTMIASFVATALVMYYLGPTLSEIRAHGARRRAARGR